MNDSVIKVLISALVLIHFTGNLWHGDAHATLEIMLPDLKAAFVVNASVMVFAVDLPRNRGRLNG